MFAYTFTSYISSYSYLKSEGRPHGYDDHIVHMLHLQFNEYYNLIKSAYSDVQAKFIIMGSYGAKNLNARIKMAQDFLYFIELYLRAGYF